MDINDRDYENARQELYSLIQVGLDDVAAERTRPWAEVKAELAKRWEV